MHMARPSGLILQPDPDVPTGLLGSWAQARGIELDAVSLRTGAAVPAPGEHAFAAVLGSVSSLAGEPEPWAHAMLDWIRAADAQDVPILGICFGAQALAAALGGSVHRLARPEIGWVTVASADEDVPPGPWLAWHEDGLVAPPGAQELARNDTGVHAFALHRHLGVQFHPEATPEILGGWAAGGAAVLAGAGVSAAALIEETVVHADANAERALRLFDAFAARAALHVSA
jgi:GMP synthase-like glutamine amidotransferase